MLSADQKTNLYATVDSTNNVRAYVEPGLPRVIQAIQCGCSLADLKDMLATHSIDVSLVGSNLLLHAATSGNSEILIELIHEYGVPESTCDKEGRNILHLALLHKQFDLVDLMSKYYQKLLTKSDSKGFISIHYIVMSKNANLLQNVLYNNACFEEVGFAGITQLVDIHRLRYENERLHQATSIITPLDWARRMKQVDMVEILEQFMHVLRVECLLRGIELYDKWSEESTLLQLTAVSARVKEAKLDSLVYLPEMVGLLTHIGIACGKRGSLQTFRLLWTFLQPLQSIDPWQHKTIVELMLSGVISGPANQIFPSHAHRERMKEKPTKLADEMNRIYRHYNWAGIDSLLEFTQVQLTERIAHNIKYNCKEPWDELVVDYLQAVVCRADTGVLVTERAAVLNYLIGLPAEVVVLHPHKFVLQGQLHLLQWAVRAGHIDLKRPVGTCASLVEHIQSLSWLTLEIKRKNKPRGIPGDLTVAEALCALAAGCGEFFIFQWLLEEVIPPARHSVTFNHRDLLHIAAVQNSLLIVKYLLARKPLPTVHLVTAIEASFAAKSYLSGQALLDYFQFEKPTLD